MLQNIYKRNIVAVLICFVLSLTTAFAQSYTITGTVKDENGEPLSGTTIQLLGINKGVISGTNGGFILENVDPGDYFIAASYVGYIPQQKSIEVQQDITLNFLMKVTQEELEEIVVTANQRLENAQKTAASVSAIDSKKIGQLQVGKFTELNSIAPNFRSYDDGSTGSYTLLASRGLSTVDITPAIGLYIDDVPYFTTLAYPLALSDLDKIEILRGPQGTLYGRNALAGVVKITTKPPTNKLSGFAKVGFGNLNAQEYGLGLNIPLVRDKLFFRTSGSFTDRDGFVENTFSDEELQDRSAAEGTAKLLYYPTERLSFSLLYGLQYRESNGLAFVQPGEDNSLQDILENSLYEVNFNEPVFQEATTHNAAFKLTYDFEKATLTSVTAFQHTDQRSLEEIDYTLLDIQSRAIDAEYQNVSQEIRLSSANPGPLQWTTGLFLYRNRNANDDIISTGIDNLLFDRENQAFVPDTLAPYQQLDNAQRIQAGSAVYGQVSYDLTEDFTITGGIRLDYEVVVVDIDRNFTPPVFPSDRFSQGADFSAISPKLSLGYQLNPETFLFANVARGFRPGGINFFVSNFEDAPFEPETALNYELGFKSNLLNNRLKLNLTTFYIDYNNQQIFTLVDVGAVGFGTDNIGEARSMGIELESQWVMGKGLVFNVNASYLNTEITEFNFTTVDFFTGEAVTSDESGNELPVSPQFSGNANLNYIFPIGDKTNLEATADYIYQSDFFFDPFNNLVQEAYGLLNGRIGVTSKHLDFFVWGKNLTDEAYYSYGFGAGGFDAAAFGLPRTYGVTLTGKF